MYGSKGFFLMLLRLTSLSCLLSLFSFAAESVNGTTLLELSVPPMIDVSYSTNLSYAQAPTKTPVTINLPKALQGTVSANTSWDISLKIDGGVDQKSSISFKSTDGNDWTVIPSETEASFLNGQQRVKQQNFSIDLAYKGTFPLQPVLLILTVGTQNLYTQEESVLEHKYEAEGDNAE